MNHRHPRQLLKVLPALALLISPAGAFSADPKPADAKPPFEIRSPDFEACVDTKTAKVEKLAGGLKFTEGPVWIPAGAKSGGFLVFSDIPANKLLKWDPAAADDKKLSTYRDASDYTNGNTLDAEGRMVHACHGQRSLLRSGQDAKVEVLAATNADGKKFNSPNDVIVAKDGAVYFTDPPYGVPKGQQRETDYHGVYRWDPKTKAVATLAKDVNFPNGIALSPDEKTLYVARSDPKEPVIRAYELKPDGSLGQGRDLCRLEKGSPDGIRVDADGRVWSSGGDGVTIYAADGKYLGRIYVPESPANLEFGGEDGKTLFVTARTGLYSVRVKVTGRKL